MAPNRDSVDAVLCENMDAVDAHGAGGFCWLTNEETGEIRVAFMLPGECLIRSLAVTQGSAPGERVWGWDGSRDKPTLEPSILAWAGCGGQKQEHWHGYLTAGRFESC